MGGWGSLCLGNKMEEYRLNWITDCVAIGNYHEVRDAALLSGNGLRSVLSLDGTLSEYDPEDLGLEDILVIRLEDGPGNNLDTFHKAVIGLSELVTNSPPVLVQCHAGRSRSVVVVAGYLMQSLNITPEHAIAMIASKREINISQGLEDMLYLL